MKYMDSEMSMASQLLVCSICWLGQTLIRHECEAKGNRQHISVRFQSQTTGGVRFGSGPPPVEGVVPGQHVLLWALQCGEDCSSSDRSSVLALVRLADCRVACTDIAGAGFVAGRTSD